MFFFSEPRGDYVIPDGIVHNFENICLKTINKSIYLEKDQKVDKIIEFKANFHCMTPKDWNIYSNLAKTMDIFLLRGYNNKIYEINGCKIRFHSIKVLISALREKIIAVKRKKIKILMAEIEGLYRGLEIKSQENLDIYVNNRIKY